MPIIDDDHPDGPLGNICLLPFVDEAEASLPLATHITKRNQKRKARKRTGSEGVEAPSGLENNRTNGLVARLKGQLKGYEQRQEKNVARIRELQKALEVHDHSQAGAGHCAP